MMLQIAGWFDSQGQFSNIVALYQNSQIRPSMHAGYLIGFSNPKHTLINRSAVFFIEVGFAYAIDIKNLYVGKPSREKPLHGENIQYMPSIYLSRLAKQGGSQPLLHLIWVIKVSSSDIGC